MMSLAPLREAYHPSYFTHMDLILEIMQFVFSKYLASDILSTTKKNSNNNMIKPATATALKGTHISGKSLMRLF